MTKEKSIMIPRRLTSFSSVSNLNLRDLDLSPYDKCIVNFTRTDFAEPLPMMSLASDLRHLRNRFADVPFICRSRDSNFRSYADHIGYFRFLGFNRGNRLGEARGSSTYVPIHLFDLDELKAKAGEEPYAELVNEEASKMAKLLVRANKGGAYTAVQYALREIIRNAVEHGFGTKAAVLGQFWPKNNTAEIVICDNGVGIAEGLKSQHDFADNFEALELALQPGISGTSENEREHQNPYYRNSGFGLYVTSRFCSERGVFRVISKDAALTLQKENVQRHNWSFDGTCIQMKINTLELEKSGDRIQQIVEEGELSSDGDESASTASKQISGWSKLLL